MSSSNTTIAEAPSVEASAHATASLGTVMQIKGHYGEVLYAVECVADDGKFCWGISDNVEVAQKVAQGSPLTPADAQDSDFGALRVHASVTPSTFQSAQTLFGADPYVAHETLKAFLKVAGILAPDKSLGISAE